MAVPNTTTFTLQNVVNEIPETINDLEGCFDNAIYDYYNASYYSSYYAAAGYKQNLLMFRDYGIHNLVTIFVTPTTMHFAVLPSFPSKDADVTGNNYGNFTIDAFPTWVLVSDKTSTTFKVNVKRNDTTSVRTWNLTVRSTNDTSKTDSIAISQLAGSAISVLPSPPNDAYEWQSIEWGVTVERTFSYIPDDCTIFWTNSPEMHYTDNVPGQIKVYPVSANDDGAERVIQATLSSGGESVTLTFSQDWLAPH